MMSSLPLRNRISATLDEFLPELPRYRHDNLAWLMTGLHEAQHVHLSKVADYRPGTASLTSKTRQLRRFLANEALDAGVLYEPVARDLLERAIRSQRRIRILIDVLQLSGKRKILVAALAYRRRALPLMWQVSRADGLTDAETQVAFLKQLEALFVGLYPERMCPIIVADGEFRSVRLIEYLDGMGWRFRLRLPSNTRIHLPDGSTCALSELDLAPGERRYLQEVYLTDLHAYGPISLAIYWGEGEQTPWFIVTDEAEASYQTLSAYSRRMWIEELFGDLEGGGFQLHQSRLYEADRLSRLLLALCLVYLWLMHLGSYVIKQGLRHLVDRRGRRDRSLAEIGRHWIRRQQTNGAVSKVGLIPYF